MQTLKFMTRPALLVALWMVVSVHTLSELSTVGPALHSAAAEVKLEPARRPPGPRLQANHAPAIAR